MRNFIYTWVLFLLVLSSQAQPDAPDKLIPYFNAIIVSNLDSSLDWYKNVLGFEVISQRHFPEMGFKQANLSNDYAAIELIELQSAIFPQDVISNYNDKTKVLGLFKFGFKVEKFDQWVNFLKQGNVQLNGQVVIDEVSNKRMVIILDPDGNRIQLF